MKPIIYNIFFLLLPFLIEAQVPETAINFNLNTGATDNKIYKARDYIKFGDGYTTSNHNLKAQIDESLLFTSDYVGSTLSNITTYDINENLSVGYILGQTSVSESGGVIYNIPLDIPQGINGIQPNISLVYNSQTKDGPLGWGWNISGISSIVRVGQTEYFDGQFTKVKFNNSNDRFALDGMRLTLSSESPTSYGGVNSKYNKEWMDYSSIIYQKDYYNGFDVTTKDGTHMVYGINNECMIYPKDDVYTSPHPYAYLISRVEDRNGNFMKYLYHKDYETGAVYIKEILYTYNDAANITVSNKITFLYDKRDISDVNTYYIDKYKLCNNSLILRQINVESNNSIVKKYKLTYKYKFRPCLQSIEESSINGDKINKTVFNTYESDPNTYYDLLSEGDLLTGTRNFIPGDFDGDGITDLFEYTYVSTNNRYILKLLKGNTNGSFNYQNIFDNGIYFELEEPPNVVDEDGIDFNGNAHIDPQTHIATGFNDIITRKYTLKFNVGDFNNDGITDLLTYFVLPRTNTPISQGEYPLSPRVGKIRIFYGNSTTPLTSFSIFNNSSISTTDEKIIKVGDFDGDGASDFIVFERPSNTDYHTRIYFPFKDNIGTVVSETNNYYSSDIFNIPSTLTSCYDLWTGLQEYRPYITFITDINEDGVNELAVADNTGNEKYWQFNITGGNLSPSLINSIQNSHCVWSIGSGDFNSDGKTDYLMTSPEAWGKGIKISRSDDFVQYGCNNLVDPSHIHDKNFYIGDFNGDGFSDILTVHSGSDFSVSYFKDENKTVIINYTSNFFTNPSINMQNSIIADFDGDGQDELLVYSTEFDRYLLLNIDDNLVKWNEISSITNGFNNKTEFKYKILKSLCDWNPTSTIYKYFSRMPLKVVSQIRQSNITNSNGEDYTYQNYIFNGGVFSYEKRVFQGFSDITITGNNNFSKSQNQTNSMISSPLGFKGMLQTSSKNYKLSGTMEFKIYTEYTNPTDYNFIDYGNKSFFVFKHKTEVNDYLKGIHSTTTINVNNDGNILDKTVLIGTSTTDGLAIEDVHKEYTESFTYDAAGLSIPHKIATINTQSIMHNALSTEDPYLTSVSFTYHPSNGLLYSHTKNDVTTTINLADYNECGLPVKTTVSSPSLLTKIEQFEYDDSKRFITMKTDPAGYISTYSYDPVSGLIKSQTDINNRTTYFEYDNWGNLIKTINSGGVESYNEIRWNDNTSIPDALYYSRSVLKYGNEEVSSYNKIYFDKFGREIVSEKLDPDNNKIITSTNYNAEGKVSLITLPHFISNSSPLTTTYSYNDFYGRLKRIDEADGSSTNYFYNNGYNEINISNSIKSELNHQYFNALGEIIGKAESGNFIALDYASNGRPSKITIYPNSEAPVETIMEYDNYGRQTKLIDTDAGTTEYRYDAYGRLLWQKDNKGNEFFFEPPTGVTEDYYDVLDRKLKCRIIKNGVPDGNYTYVYDNDVNNKGTLSSEEAPNGVENTYTYDNFGRITSTSKTISGNSFIKSYKYNNIGNLKEETYPTDPSGHSESFSIEYQYTDLGFLKQVNNKANDQPIWTIPDNSYNDKGQLLELDLGNGLNTYWNYNNFGNLTSVKTGTSQTTDLLQDYSYIFDNNWSRPNSRTNAYGYRDIDENDHSVTENFGYDADLLKLNRLTSVSAPGFPNKDMTINYLTNGNINFKTNIGIYSYTGSQPHAVNMVENTGNPTGIISADEQVIDYNAFNKVNYIKEKLIAGSLTNYEKELYFTYGVDNQRIKTEYKNYQVVEKTKYFIDNYELEQSTIGTRQLHYISSPIGLVAIYEIKNGTGTMHYTHKDHSGSITEISDQQGILQQRIVYNAWGIRELIYNNPNSGYSNFMFDRGYTGHEHLEQFKLINMNGRLYDPILGRMLSPDNYVQNSLNSQSFNRYSYCFNNPMVFTDPDGEIAQWILGGIIGGITNWAINGAEFSNSGFNYFAMGAVSGAMGTFTTSPSGTALNDLGQRLGITGLVGGALWGAGTGAAFGGLTGGLYSYLSGGDFNLGFRNGAISGAISGAFFGGQIGYKDAKSKGYNPWTGSKQPFRNNWFYNKYYTSDIRMANSKYLGLDDKYLKFKSQSQHNLENGLAVTEQGKKIGTVFINGKEYNRYSANIYFSRRVINDYYYGRSSLVSENDIYGTFYHEPFHASTLISGNYDYLNSNYSNNYSNFIQEYNAYQYEYIMNNGSGFYPMYYYQSINMYTPFILP